MPSRSCAVKSLRKPALQLQVTTTTAWPMVTRLQLNLPMTPPLRCLPWPRWWRVSATRPLRFSPTTSISTRPKVESVLDALTAAGIVGRSSRGSRPVLAEVADVDRLVDEYLLRVADRP